MRGGILLLAALLLIGAPAAARQPPAAGASSAIMAIRGPLPLQGPPPFACTGLLLAACLGMAMAARARWRKHPGEAAVTIQLRGSDELATLREAYERDNLPVDLLFLRLSGIAGSCLVTGDHGAMTSAELLEAATDKFAPERLAAAEELFAACDQVRFGDCRPDAAAVDAAFAAARLLMNGHSGSAP
jgi:hypothetical protein